MACKCARHERGTFRLNRASGSEVASVVRWQFRTGGAPTVRDSVDSTTVARHASDRIFKLRRIGLSRAWLAKKALWQQKKVLYIDADALQRGKASSEWACFRSARSCDRVRTEVSVTKQPTLTASLRHSLGRMTVPHGLAVLVQDLLDSLNEHIISRKVLGTLVDVCCHNHCTMVEREIDVDHGSGSAKGRTQFPGRSRVRAKPAPRGGFIEFWILFGETREDILTKNNGRRLVAAVVEALAKLPVLVPPAKHIGWRLRPKHNTSHQRGYDIARKRVVVEVLAF